MMYNSGTAITQKNATALRQQPVAWANLYKRSTMRKRTTTPAIGQLSLFDYKPDPYWFLDCVDNSTLYGHMLAYQQTDEFRQDLIAQFAREAALPSSQKETKRQYTKAYRERNPELAKRRDRLEFHKPKIKAELSKVQRGACYYCGCKLDDKAQIDHKVPMINGGSDDMSNLALVCAWCNRHKHVKSEDEWRKSPKLAVRMG